MPDKSGDIFGSGSKYRFGQSTFSNAAGAVQDIFGGMATAEGLRIKARGNLAEADNYDLAAGLADKNATFAEVSTGLKVFQANRALYQALGTTEADVAGAGFTMSGSAIDLMRDSASQGALTREVLRAQGMLQEEGFQEQAKSFRTMSAAARQAADDENHLAGKAELAGYITGGLKIASLFVGA